jgi:hypothetical protein
MKAEDVAQLKKERDNLIAFCKDLLMHHEHWDEASALKLVFSGARGGKRTPSTEKPHTCPTTPW